MISVGILLFVIIMTAVLLFAVLSNGLVIYCVIKIKKLRTITNVLVCNLSVSDILLAGFIMPQRLHDIYHKDHFFEGKLRQTNVYVCASGFSPEKFRYGRPALHFILTKYCIWILHFLQHFSSFSSIFDNILLTIHNKMFRVGAKA